MNGTAAADVTYLIRTTGVRMRFLADAIESVRRQSRPSVPLVVVDAKALPMRTLEELAYLKAAETAPPSQEPRVRFTTAGSMAGAYNAGLAVVGTPFLCVLDDDDIVYTHHAESLARALEADPAKGVAYTGVTLVECDPVTNAPIRKKLDMAVQAFDPNELRYANKVPVHGAMQRLSVTGREPWDAEEGPCCDWGHWWRLHAKGVGFVHVPGIAAEYRIRNATDSNGDRPTMEHYSRVVQRRAAGVR